MGDKMSDARPQGQPILYRLLCRLGLHQWVNGRGYIPIGPGCSAYYDGPRCIWCWRCKNAPDLKEYIP